MLFCLLLSKMLIVLFLPTHLKRDKMLQAGMVRSLYKRVFRISNKQAHKSAHPNEQRERIEKMKKEGRNQRYF